MMGYVFAPLWAALQIGFMRLFLSAFLPVRCRREERVWIIALAWLAMTLYALFGVQGFHAYLMYLLAAVLFLLVLHGEYGPRGLCLLALTFLIPVAVDQAVADLASGLPQWLYWLTVTGGKALPAVLVLVLRRLKLLAGAKPIQPDGDMLLLRQHMEMQQESMLRWNRTTGCSAGVPMNSSTICRSCGNCWIGARSLPPGTTWSG